SGLHPGAVCSFCQERSSNLPHMRNAVGAAAFTGANARPIGGPGDRGNVPRQFWQRFVYCQDLVRVTNWLPAAAPEFDTEIAVCFRTNRKAFSVIKYLGSKRVLVPVLGQIMSAVGASTAVDLFTGTTRVAQEFKR